MYVSIFTNVCVYIFTYTCIYIYIRIFMYVYMYIYLYICKYISIYMYTYICICIYIYVYVCVCAYIHIYINIHIYFFDTYKYVMLFYLGSAVLRFFVGLDFLHFCFVACLVPFFFVMFINVQILGMIIREVWNDLDIIMRYCVLQ